MAAVNMDELALKAITQQAEVMVRLASIDTALIDISRRSEKRDEQFNKMMTKIVAMEQRLDRDIKDREVTDKRVDEIEDKLDRLIEAIGQHAQQCSTHITGHCDDCDNDSRIGTLETTSERLTKAVDELVEKVRLLAENQALNEVRTMITTPYGLNWLRFNLSYWGQIWLAVVTAVVLLAMWSHYGHIKLLYQWVTFGGG